MHLQCGHTYCLGCIGKHIDTQCKEAKARVDIVLSASDADFSLPGGELSLVALHRGGRIRRCPRDGCGYGPVINQQCDDLAVHDSSRGQGSGRTTNSCPVCGFFSKNWADWAEWLPTNPTVAARCPECRGCCCASAPDIETLSTLLKSLDMRLAEWDHLEVHHTQVANNISGVLLLLQRGVGADGGTDAVRVSPGQARGLLTGKFADLLQRRIDLERPAFLRAFTLDFARPRDLDREIIEEVRSADEAEIAGEHAQLVENRIHARLLLEASDQDGQRTGTLVPPPQSAPLRRQRVFRESVGDTDVLALGEPGCFLGVILLVCPRCVGRRRRSRSLPSPGSEAWIPPEFRPRAEDAGRSEVGSSLRRLVQQLHDARAAIPVARGRELTR